jgi:hypothetical protein
MLNLTIKNNGFDSFQNNPFEISQKHISEFEKAINNKDLKVRNDDISVISTFDDYPELFGVYKNILSVLKFNDIHNIKFEDVWIQKKYNRMYIENELPNIPHIDKIRKIKIMIYFNEIKIENGPIHLIKSNPNNFEKIRVNLKKDYKLRKENSIKDFLIENYQACTGHIGTSIFFDTNTPHFAGKFYFTNKENFRKTARFNFCAL